MAFGSLQPTARRGARRGRRRPFTEINIVPLTDVVLVLLIIFMVTAQFIQKAPEQGMPLNLPSASQVNSLDDLGGLRVRVGKDGRMAVNGQPVEPAGLAEALRTAARSPQQLVIVEGDRETVLQSVVTIMDAAAGAGLTNVVLATAADTPMEPTAEVPPVPAGAPAPQAAPTGTPADAKPLGDTPFVTPPPAN